jgi:exoribonuclease R
VTSAPTPIVRSYLTQQSEIFSGASKPPSESEHAPVPTQATPADSHGDKTLISIRSPLKKRNAKSGRVHKVLELKVDTISLTKVPVVDLLAKSSGLSKVKVKEAMIKGTK